MGIGLYPYIMSQDRATSSMYSANNIGDKTEPCRTFKNFPFPVSFHIIKWVPGIHFVCNRCKTTSSVVILPILPNIIYLAEYIYYIALAARWKERLDCSVETLKLFELTICTPKYFISVFHGKCVQTKNTDVDT